MNTLLGQALQHLRDQDGRMTPQRRLIIQTVETLDGHPTAEQIYQQAHRTDPALNLATVYRTLRWLEREKLITPQRFESEPRRECFEPHPPMDHHHFECISCKRVIEFSGISSASLFAKVEKQLHVHVDSAALVVRGWCEECWSRRQEMPSAASQ